MALEAADTFQDGCLLSGSSPLLTADLFARYQPAEGGIDEFVDEQKKIRPHYSEFVGAINRLGKKEFSSRWELSQRMVHENGLAYGGHGLPKDKPRPWALDAIPLLIPAAEWKTISDALQQRAQVLDLTLRDLYGDQQLIKTGVLPPSLLFANPGFLFPCHGPSPSQRGWLDFYAADIARAPDGRWWVLSDRTEAPSGLGYVLENRMVVSRMLPDVFREIPVRRLGTFFSAIQEQLGHVAPRQHQNPRIVLLSNGPASPNYFEDAYLARYLGYTLVEGGDLTVRNNSVHLKTLGGLLPVDVIFRRQNSVTCDPLELDGSSTIGIAGLTQAARSENVAIINPLGSGLVESTAFMAFMPQLCQALLDQPLKMPGVATHWCGIPTSLDYVLKNLAQLTIHPAFRKRGSDGPLREKLNQLTPAELAEQIRKTPGVFAAQERVLRSTVPLWNGTLDAGNIALRSYAVRERDSYRVMPGALARVARTMEPLEVSIRRGEGSKDVWILADGPQNEKVSIDRQPTYADLRRNTADLPSRAADNLFWLGRYFERADASARLLRSTTQRLIGETRFSSPAEIPVLLRCLADQGLIETGYGVERMRNTLQPIDGVLPDAALDPNQRTSLRSVVNELHRLGSIVRDRISLDTWRIIHSMEDVFKPPGRGNIDLASLIAISNDLITELSALSGMVTESMTRTQAYRFLELGRRIERSSQIIRLVKNFLIPMPTIHGPILETILEVADSLMTYRSRYLANVQLAPVLDLLLTDETNPRSLAFQFERLQENVDQLPRDRDQPGYTAAQQTSFSMIHSIRLLNVQAVAETHCLGQFRPFEKLLTEWEASLPQLSEAISLRYLVHADQAQQLSGIAPQ